jgi:hypothetical protein
MKRLAILPVIVLIAGISAAAEPLKLSCEARVPSAYKADPPGWTSPTGESEAQRYTRAYEAFCWNCVMVKANAIDARCPSSCSGTPAATAGCADGGVQAAEGVSMALRMHPQGEVQRYLRGLASGQEAKRRAASYFPNGPESTKP